jgi:hypothetical protein
MPHGLRQHPDCTAVSDSATATVAAAAAAAAHLESHKSARLLQLQIQPVHLPSTQHTRSNSLMRQHTPCWRGLLATPAAVRTTSRSTLCCCCCCLAAALLILHICGVN